MTIHTEHHQPTPTSDSSSSLPLSATTTRTTTTTTTTTTTANTAISPPSSSISPCSRPESSIDQTNPFPLNLSLPTDLTKNNHNNNKLDNNNNNNNSNSNSNSNNNNSNNRNTHHHHQDNIPHLDPQPHPVSIDSNRNINHSKHQPIDRSSSSLDLNDSYPSTHLIILPTDPILFPELFNPPLSVSSTLPTDLIHPLSNSTSSKACVVSIGEIPSASETRTGIPFEDGFPCYPNYHHQNPDQTRLGPRRYSVQIADEDDVNHRPANSSPTQRQIAQVHHSIDGPSHEAQAIQEPRKGKLDDHPANESSDSIQEQGPNPMLTTISETNARVFENQGLLNSSLKHTPGLESSPRVKEAWLSDLKTLYHNNRHSDQVQVGQSSSSDHHPLKSPIPSYPSIGQTFSSLQHFKEACLMAAWSAGHDMHVRNHYKTNLWERCVFSCRYDRPPPKGVDCPFKIVALGDKPNGSGPITVWEVVKCHPSHRNHQVRPGSYDPLGKRTYRKRSQADRENEHESNYPKKKRGRPLGSKNQKANPKSHPLLPPDHHPSTIHQDANLEVKSEVDKEVVLVQEEEEKEEEVDHLDHEEEEEEEKEEEEEDEKVDGDDDDDDDDARDGSFSVDRIILNSITKNPNERIGSSASSTRPRRSLAKYDHPEPSPTSNKIHHTAPSIEPTIYHSPSSVSL